MNGWTNRETWLINLWFAYDNQEELDDIKNMVDEEIANLQQGLPGYLTDLLGTSFIMDEINPFISYRNFQHFRNYPYKLVFVFENRFIIK